MWADCDYRKDAAWYMRFGRIWWFECGWGDCGRSRRCEGGWSLQKICSSYFNFLLPFSECCELGNEKGYGSAVEIHVEFRNITPWCETNSSAPTLTGKGWKSNELARRIQKRTDRQFSLDTNAVGYEEVTFERMGRWVLEWSDCDPAQCWVELLHMWRSGGIREQLTCKQGGSISTPRAEDASKALVGWMGKRCSNIQSNESCW